MQTVESRPMLFQKLFRWMVFQAKKNRVPLCSAILFGFLAHTFAFTNKLLNHDEANSLFSKGGTVVLGRWGLGALDSIFPNFSMPWIYGIITIFLIAISVCVLVHILEFRNKWVQVFASGFVLTFPSLTGTFGYMFTSSSYGVAFLLAVLTVWLLQRETFWYWLGAVICMVASLSIYQAYVSIAAGVLILVLIRQLLEGQNAGSVFKRGICYVLFLATALGIYFAATQFILKWKHIQMVSYASDSIAFSPLSIPANILLAYHKFFQYFQEGTFRLIPTMLSQRLHLILLLSAGILLILRLRKRDFPSSLLLVALILMLPLAINCMFLFTSVDSVHTLVLYSFVCLYLLVLVLADTSPAEKNAAEYLRRIVMNAAVMLSVAILVINIYVANASYLTLHLRYENAYAFYTSLIADLKTSPDFTEGTRLAVIGTWKEPEYYSEHLDFTHTLTGATGFLPDSYSKQTFLNHYLGFSIPFASQEEESSIAATDAYAKMPVYPYYGSMQKFGDIMVIKLS